MTDHEAQNGPIFLKKMNESDISSRYVEWLNNREHMRFSNQRFKEHSLSTSREYLESFDQENSLIFKIMRDKDFVGTISMEIDKYNSVCVMGMLIGVEFSGQGIGIQSWNLGIDFAFSQKSVRKIKAGTAASNIPMKRIFLKTRMSLEATLSSDLIIDDSPQDLLIYSRFSDELFQQEFVEIPS